MFSLKLNPALSGGLSVANWVCGRGEEGIDPGLRWSSSRARASFASFRRHVREQSDSRAAALLVTWMGLDCTSGCGNSLSAGPLLLLPSRVDYFELYYSKQVHHSEREHLQ